MSRLGKIPVNVPKGVEIKVEKEIVHVKGPKGALSEQIPEGIEVEIQDQKLLVSKTGNKLPDAYHGLYRSLINNMIIGVSVGFEKRLNLVGVGFRAAVQGNELDLKIGFSHPTKLNIPADLAVNVEKSTEIVITGINKQTVGQFAADIRRLRKPEPYKGKGIRYKDEHVRKKAGKAAKGKSG